MKRIRSFVIVLSSLGLIHCSNKSSDWTRTPAPQKESDLGYIVTASEAEVSQIQLNQPQARVRRLNSTLFEVAKVDGYILKSFLSNKQIHKNQLVKNALKKVNHEPFKSRATTPDAELAIQTCKESDKAPEIDAEINFNPETLTVELGTEVSIKAKATAHAEIGGDIRFIWDVISTPSFSSFKLSKGITSEQTFKPDSVGQYQLVVLAQDKNLSCNYIVIPVLVTANPTLQNNFKLASIPATDKFVQLNTIHATNAWPTTRGQGIVVAVLDTGLNYNHPGIRDNLAFNTHDSDADDIDNDNNGFKNDSLGWDFINGDNKPFDDEGHGSHVAGLVASPIMGVAPQTQILPVKVLSAAGSGDIASIVAGIHYAVDAGANIINMSLSLDDVNNDGPPPLMLEALEYARSKNVLVLAAAGNGDPNTGIGFNLDGRPNYPAAFNLDNLISVAATALNHITQYSNFSSKSVHLAAPGGEFFAGKPKQAQQPLFSLTTLNPTDLPFTASVGTSMATPVASGLAALILSANSTLKPQAVRQIMMETGDPLESLKDKVISGNQINAQKAVQKALDLKLAVAAVQ